MLNRRMLSKDDEAAVGKDETEVRREDQDKINRFSRLHAKESTLDDRLKDKKKDKEDLEELSGELELADDDEKVNYKIGDSFFTLSVSEVQELLEAATTKAEAEASEVEERLDSVREEMRQLKVDLYARFGRSINLET